MTTPIRASNIFQKSLALFHQNLKIYVFISLCIHIPFQIVATYVVFLGNKSYVILIIFLALIENSIVAGALLYGVYSSIQERDFSVRRSLSIAIENIKPITAIAVLSGILQGLGILFFIVPGIVLACMYWVTIPVLVVEKIPIREVFARSSALTEGNKLSIFVLYLFLGAMSILLGMISLSITRPLQSQYFILSFFISTLSASIISSISSIAMIIGYYELRKEKENIPLDQILSILNSHDNSDPTL